MKVRRKPLIFEAVLWDGSEGTRQQLMEWMPGQVTYLKRDPLQIHTLEGLMTVQVGSYIIQGTEGEFWAIKPAAFAASYDILPPPVIPSLEVRRSCNLHADCDAAAAKARAEGRFIDHCHDDECRDCFGDYV